MSEFQYATFISYRNGTKNQTLAEEEGANLLDTFAKQLYDALLSELAAQMDIKNIFLDQVHLKIGDKFVIKIGNALCNTFCYVVIFTRNYLSTKKLFCAAELMAMLDIEQKRFQQLNVSTLPKSFIFTIPLNCPHLVPDVLSSTIYKNDFSSFTLSETPLIKNPNYTSAIRALAVEIGALYSNLEDDEDNLLGSCNGYKMKDPEDALHQKDIIDFVKQHRKKEPNFLLNS